MVIHDASLAEERPHLLASVVEAAGLAIEIARLRVELRRQLDEVEASRARIVAAGYEERRRIERDLHDGAQQRLVTVGLALAPSPARARRRDPTAQATSSTASWMRSGARSQTCASSRAGSAPPSSTTASRPRCASSATAPRSPIEVLRRPRALPGAHRGRCLLHRLRRPHQRDQARERIEDHGQRRPRDERLVISVMDDGGGGATPPAGPASPASPTVSRRKAARSASKLRRRPARTSPWSSRWPRPWSPMRVVIAEDQVLLREGLRGCSKTRGTRSSPRRRRRTAAARGGRTPPRSRGRRCPDAPDVHRRGRARSAAIRDEHPDVAVLVLSQHVEIHHAVALVTQGGFGYLLKDRVLDVQEFMAAAERVCDGGSALDPLVVASLVSRATDRTRSPS